MTGTRVLVIDDDEALGELLTEYLGRLRLHRHAP